MSSALDLISKGHFTELDGKTIALLSNHTAVTEEGLHAVQVFLQRGIKIKELLAPEHGFWSVAQDMEPVSSDAKDPIFKIPVRSLYGQHVKSLHLPKEALLGLDALVYDIQDIGSRYYTYAATLAFAMKAASEAKIPVFVLDRPNPIGKKVEGPLLRPGFESFCGITSGLPIRHGLSVSELAEFYKKKLAKDCDLRLVPFPKNAKAGIFFPTSPNMPTLDTAYVYPGLCLLEGTSLSEGRGTTSPFLSIGAPHLDSLSLIARLNERRLPGIHFLPTRFRPAISKHKGEVCDGIYLRVTDQEQLQAVPLGVYILEAMAHVNKDAWTWRKDAYEFVEDIPAIDLLWGSAELRHALDKGQDVEELLKSAEVESKEWTP